MNALDQKKNRLEKSELDLAIAKHLAQLQASDPFRHLCQLMSDKKDREVAKLTAEGTPLSEYEQGLSHGFIRAVNAIINTPNLTPEKRDALEAKIEVLRKDVGRMQDVNPKVFGADPDIGKIVSELEKLETL